MMGTNLHIERHLSQDEIEKSCSFQNTSRVHFKFTFATSSIKIKNILTVEQIFFPNHHEFWWWITIANGPKTRKVQSIVITFSLLNDGKFSYKNYLSKNMVISYPKKLRNILFSYLLIVVYETIFLNNSLEFRLIRFLIILNFLVFDISTSSRMVRATTPITNILKW